MQSRYFTSKKRSNPCASKLFNSLATPLDNICPICLDKCSDITNIDGCTHKFCFTCIVSWTKITPKCPLCKTEILKCSTIDCLPSRLFVPDVQPLSDEESEDENEVSTSISGYETDEGFVVDDECLEYDELEDETESNKILDRADEILLPQKRRKLHDLVTETRGTSTLLQSSYSYSSISNSNNTGFLMDIDSLLKSYELKE